MIINTTVAVDKRKSQVLMLFDRIWTSRKSKIAIMEMADPSQTQSSELETFGLAKTNLQIFRDLKWQLGEVKVLHFEHNNGV